MSEQDADPPAANKVLDEIAAERARQISVEGWTPWHDDEHRKGELAKAAACYAVGQAEFGLTNFRSPYYSSGRPLMLWPWEWKWWKRKDRRRDLVRAAALIVAEIERLDRQHNAGVSQ